MLIRGNIVRGSASPETEEFDAISAEGSNYPSALEALRAAVPEGWQLAGIITDR